jgi:hypothetical protein
VQFSKNIIAFFLKKHLKNRKNAKNAQEKIAKK